MNIKKWATGAGLALALTSGTASALVLYTPITGFEDDDLDWVVDNNQNGILDVGDRLISVIEFGKTFGIPSGGPTDIVGEELTGVADITIASKLSTGGGSFFYTFAPSGAAGVLSGQPAGAMIALYLDGTPDLDVVNGNCGLQAACLAAASNGNLWAVAGINGTDADAIWYGSTGSPAIAAPSDIIANFDDAAPTTKLGTFNVGLQILLNNTGYILIEQDCTPGACTGLGDGKIGVIGSGDFLGGQFLSAQGSDAHARSDADFQIARIPEPGALALLGIALVGAASVARRRKA